MTDTVHKPQVLVRRRRQGGVAIAKIGGERRRGNDPQRRARAASAKTRLGYRAGRNGATIPRDVGMKISSSFAAVRR